jgi:SseB protein N-terminal domain
MKNMNQLEQAIKNAYDSNGKQKEVNKAHCEFLKANFMVPIEKGNKEATVLFITHDDNTYLPAFNDKKHLHAWAEDIKDDIEVLHLSGVDLIKGLGEKTTLCLNIGSKYYKEFPPQELSKLKTIVAKFFNS